MCVCCVYTINLMQHFSNHTTLQFSHLVFWTRIFLSYLLPFHSRLLSRAHIYIQHILHTLLQGGKAWIASFRYDILWEGGVRCAGGSMSQHNNTVTTLSPLPSRTSPTILCLWTLNVHCEKVELCIVCLEDYDTATTTNEKPEQQPEMTFNVCNVTQPHNHGTLAKRFPFNICPLTCLKQASEL